MKPFGQDVLQISTNKLGAFDSGCQPPAAFMVFVAECNMCLVHAHNPIIGMSVTSVGSGSLCEGPQEQDHTKTFGLTVWHWRW